LLKNRSASWKIRPETEKEREQRQRDTKRTDAPSPHTYKTEDALKRIKKATSIHSFSKGKNLKFTGIVGVNR